MGNELRFDGRVAIVTGAGQGLGRTHALLLASRGAKVVVNDLGGAANGGGKSSAAADAVVAAIKEAGGEAVANYDSVEDGAKIVQTALDTWKRVDIVVNNAGILRDSSFPKMSEQDWELIYRVHLLGAFRVTHAAWDHMREANYGRVIFTSSAAGLYGNFGQANYSAVKMGLVGLGKTLALEGAKKNIHVNTIAPLAGSRLTETILPKEVVDALRPEYVSPLVGWLCHESCEENGGTFEVGGGFYAKLRWERTEGKTFKLGRNITPDTLEQAWPQITDFKRATHPADTNDAFVPVMGNLGTQSRGGNALIDADEAVGAELPETISTHDERDLALYALGVGAAQDPLDTTELQYVYERHPDGFRPLPTYGVVPAITAVLQQTAEGRGAPGLHYGLDRVLHGEQYTELLAPLPPKATLRHKAKIKDVFDKGKHALVVTEVVSVDAQTGEELVRNEITTFVRGAGGFGGARGPSAELNVPPERAPDAVITEKTHDNQALLYRLSGDWNPLHADPSFAQNFGFPKPILHGLCTFGYVGRQVLKQFAGGDSRLFKSIRVRFADTVFPGETLKTELWKEGQKIVLRCTAVERNKVVISNAAVELHAEVPKAKENPKDAAAPVGKAGGGSRSAPVFEVIGAYVAAHPELIAKVANVYTFQLKGPDSAWTLDLKHGAGSVALGAAAKADCTLELTEADFLDMTDGKADPQKLYFGGKLKVSGNVMASQKLNFLTKIDPSKVASAPTKPGAAPTVAGASHVPALVAALGKRLQENLGLAKEVEQAIQFVVSAPDAAFVVDLSGTPSVKEGTADKVQATLHLSDASLVALVADPAQAGALFMHGQLTIEGDVQVAHHLGFLKQLL